MHQKVRRLLDINNAKEGDVRFGRNEGWAHYLAKCIIVRLLKEGVFINWIPNILNQYIIPTEFLANSKYASFEDFGKHYEQNSTSQKLKKWQTPFVYTEARFSKNLITDILAVTIDGIYVIEIIDNETEKSLKGKRRLYKNMGMNEGLKFNLIEVRV